jgi:hypothetical protein
VQCKSIHYHYYFGNGHISLGYFGANVICVIFAPCCKAQQKSLVLWGARLVYEQNIIDHKD